MNDPWNRISWQVANADPSDIALSSSGGILGDFGRFTEMRPAAQSPSNIQWNTQRALGQTWAQWPARPPVETYDPETLKFAAAWRRLYSIPRPPVFAPASDPLPSYGQPSNDAENPEFLSPVAPAGDWPRGEGFTGAHELTHPQAAAVPASYQTGARPWWTPVSPPDVFDPWREHAAKGLLGLYKFFFDPGAYPSGGGDRNGPGCKEEWDEAREKCAEWLSSPNPPRRRTGGYRNVEDCARGLVSERCGGNALER